MLTAAQKATSTAAIARTFQFAGTLSAVWPPARFALDPVIGIKEFSDGVGATSKILVSPAKVKQMMAAQAKQAAASQALAETQAGAASAKDLSSTSLAPGNALSALVGGGAAGGGQG